MLKILFEKGEMMVTRVFQLYPQCFKKLLLGHKHAELFWRGCRDFKTLFHRFDIVGYGCMTCIGNSGPLPEPVGEAIEKVSNIIIK